jgi:hypothetical protein
MSMPRKLSFEKFSFLLADVTRHSAGGALQAMLSHVKSIYSSDLAVFNALVGEHKVNNICNTIVLLPQLLHEIHSD